MLLSEVVPIAVDEIEVVVPSLVMRRAYVVFATRPIASRTNILMQPHV